MHSSIRKDIEKFQVKLRKHYNKNKKAKISFLTEEEAFRYISKHKLLGYVIYKCTICNNYHISSHSL